MIGIVLYGVCVRAWRELILALLDRGSLHEGCGHVYATL